MQQSPRLGSLCEQVLSGVKEIFCGEEMCPFQTLGENTDQQGIMSFQAGYKFFFSNFSFCVINKRTFTAI